MAEHILVADDEAATRDLLDAILTPEGFRVDQAVDGPSALAKAFMAPPDLILLDLLMPGMTGFEVCQRLKRDPATEAVPVIVVSAAGQGITREAALTSGADDFLPKPVDPLELRMRIGAMLRARRIQEQVGRALGYIHELEAARHAHRLAVAVSAAPRENTNRLQASAPAPILLVDDEALTREFFADLLDEQGFEVFTAASGLEGLDLASQHPMEAAIVDVVMPGMSGLELLERLQGQDPDLPVIMLTGHPNSQYSLAALKMGAFDFITKGLNLSLVILSVHRAVRFRREQRDMRAEIGRLRARNAELERDRALEGRALCPA